MTPIIYVSDHRDVFNRATREGKSTVTKSAEGSYEKKKQTRALGTISGSSGDKLTHAIAVLKLNAN